MASLDWIFLAVLLGSLVLGAWRGLIYEVLSLAGWVMAFFMAQWWAEDVGRWLPISDSAESVRHAAGFALAFIGTLFACGFLAWLAKKLIEAVGLRPVDRTLGAAFGALRGMVLLLAASLVVLWTPLQEGLWWKESQAAPILTGVLEVLKPALPPALGRHLPS
ncbi:MULTISPECIES: CvpA family protein [unclassified Acidovorax]|uniref:CvpA family protein n=1 Tax=unclassified Acidovorax TaxID=2684926 RepID=UPI00234AE46D|nr:MULTISPECIES: CvpA family protein [unclassified Acidovorax]WCM99472.1 CvpA family protein [Acidovorax sp. GBBC 1281]GKS90837.1 CvpA family protein [Acidovorax sp. SUPP2539]GKS95261.1 CvpA family protein [Acidovorax sp. SUPP2825]GKT00320.1 CvpA family protein [Acidovorax sp. SUPP3434]GKT19612.1 CvpA family protein [Acidovorax sp. SUPP2522]